jgi:hypothetical protein
MINDILELKWRLPLPDLLKQTGLGAHAKRSAACPLHEDTTPSFSVFQTTRGWRFKCHAGCGEGDEITFLEKWRGLSRGEAIRFYAGLAFAPGAWGFDYHPQTPRDRAHETACGAPSSGAKVGVKISLPEDVHEGDEHELRTLASLRSVSFWAVAAMKQLGALRFGTVCGQASWIVLDSSLRSAEARRLDGKRYPQTAHLGERKVHTLRGSAKNWPVGLLPDRELGAHFKRILLLEGSGDLVAGYHFALGSKGEWLPAALLGASISRLHPEALELLRSRPIRIIPHCDTAGAQASERWTQELVRAGCHGDVVSLKGLRKKDGSPLKDLNDATELHPGDADEFAQLLS